jgi:hypothetical protein
MTAMYNEAGVSDGWVAMKVEDTDVR